VIEGHEPDDPEMQIPVIAQRGMFVNLVDPGFIGTMQIPIIAGRGFTENDLAAERGVVVVNETLARRWFGDESPLGWRLGLDDELPPDLEIVGVVGDVQYSRLQNEQMATVHVPYTSADDWLGEMTIAVRTTGEAGEIAAGVRRVVQAFDAAVPVYNVRTLSAQRDDTLIQERQFARISTSLGLLALVLACIGLYGILSYTVAGRTREIGVRMALGARAGDVVRLMLSELRPVMAGIVIGVVASFGAMRGLRSLLYGLSPTDPTTLAGAVIILATVAVAAAWLPARRAARVDPAVALRSE
jgi:predicted permease